MKNRDKTRLPFFVLLLFVLLVLRAHFQGSLFDRSFGETEIRRSIRWTSWIVSIVSVGRSRVINAMLPHRRGSSVFRGNTRTAVVFASRDTGAQEVRLPLVWRRDCDDKWEVTV